MKELLIIKRTKNEDTIKLDVDQILQIDDSVYPSKDIISPQKTTFEILKNDKVNIGQLVVIKKGKETEYIGIVQDIETQDKTKLAVYPLIHMTDTEFLLTSINGNVFNWITSTFNKAFVTREDKDLYMSLPLSFEDHTGGVILNLPLENGNLFDALLSIFLKTGVYIDFSLEYTQGKISSIICKVNRANDENKHIIRYDNPILYETPTIEFSQAQSTNKLILVPAENANSATVYTFYLLDDNTVTQNVNDPKRIKGVVQEVIEYQDDDVGNIQTLAENQLVGDAYSHKISLKMLNNVAYDLKLYDKVEYIDKQKVDGKNKTYITYVTRIEQYDEYKIILLGVLRNRLTDKLKELEKTQTYTTVSSFGGGGGGSSFILYDTTGTNTDGAMTQKATTDELKKKVEYTEAIDTTADFKNVTLKDSEDNNIYPTTTFSNVYNGDNKTLEELIGDVSNLGEKANKNADNLSAEDIAEWQNKLSLVGEDIWSSNTSASNVTVKDISQYKWLILNFQSDADAWSSCVFQASQVYGDLWKGQVSLKVSDYVPNRERYVLVKFTSKTNASFTITNGHWAFLKGFK